jgi:hypothetical protein
MTVTSSPRPESSGPLAIGSVAVKRVSATRGQCQKNQSESFHNYSPIALSMLSISSNRMGTAHPESCILTAPHCGQ